MLAPALDTVRLTLHVLAATVWVGGQIVMMGLVGPARGLGADAPKVLAQAFARLAWPAFVVLIATGIWNITAAGPGSHSSSYRTTLIVKLVVVAVSGVTAALHIRARTARSRAVFGALTGLSALAALFLGVLLAG